MADNVTLPGTGAVIATDDDGTQQHQWVKLEWGPADTFNKVDTASGKPLPVQLRSPTGTDLTGTAGTASAAVVTVQGVASMTPMLTQPASATAPVSTMNSASANSGVNSAMAAVFDDTGPTAITENSFGFLRMSTNRNLYGTIRDAAGNERGTNVDASNRLTTAPTLISGSVASGAYASGAFASGAFASGSVASGAFASGSIAAGAVAAGASSFVKLEDVASADADAGVPAMAVRKATPANTSNADGDYEMLQMSAGRLYVRGEGRFFSAAATTNTRPANTTAYSANDSISNNATAGSVTALSATLSDTNDDPLCITAVVVDTTDTGLAASIQIRAYLYNSDPTASTGVVGGDNAAFSNKKAGFLGCLSGTFRAFSDGGKARLVPEEGNYIVCPPTSGAKTIFIQYQALMAFTPSANSTTLIGTIEGFQGRA